MLEMICRRRRLFLVALLCGLAWFLLLPSLSDFYTKSNDTDSQIIVNNLKVLDSRDFRISRSGRDAAKQMEMKEDDLSEIDYDRPEEKKITFANRLNAYYYTSHPWTLMVRRHYIKTPSYAKTSAFNLPSVKPKEFAGHKGRMVRVDPKSLSASERKVYDAGWETYFHNEYVNNIIPAQRVLSDVRNPACRSVKYSTDGLPTASIVIVFYNEAWKTLLRTVHSVLDRSPNELIKEILLVDDASTHDHLKSQLSNYMSHLTEVRIIRLITRQGASHARHIGASLAKGNAIVFLDAHCECTTGWLEPLLVQIAKNTANVAVPVLDIIDDDTFAYKAYDSMHIRVGGFDWSLAYKWDEISDRRKQGHDNEIEPIRNPVMWGGIFAISRSFLNLLGGFDRSLSMFGKGQNLEMSLKIWMCGGSIETIPCSHIGHLFHQQSSFHHSLSSDATLRNYAKIAHMWLDDFKDLHFQQTGKSSLPMNISAGHWALRERLHCHSFERYLRNVYPDLFAPSLALASGKVRSKMRVSTEEGKATLCLSIRSQNGNKRLELAKCRSFKEKEGFWLLSQKGEIRQGNSCLDYPGNSVLLYPCHGGRGNQEWTYREDRTIKQVGTRRCLTLSSDGGSLSMEECDGSDHQVWYWKRLSNANDAKAADRSKNDTKPLVTQELAAVFF